MTPAQKRKPIQLSTPPILTLTWWPVNVICCAIDGYFEAFFACFDWDSLK